MVCRRLLTVLTTLVFCNHFRKSGTSRVCKKQLSWLVGTQQSESMEDYWKARSLLTYVVNLLWITNNFCQLFVYNCEKYSASNLNSHLKSNYKWFHVKLSQSKIKLWQGKNLWRPSNAKLFRLSVEFFVSLVYIVYPWAFWYGCWTWAKNRSKLLRIICWSKHIKRMWPI